MMKITYTPQQSNRPMKYNNNLEKEIVRVTIGGDKEIVHDLSFIEEIKRETNEDEEEMEIGFPVVGMPKRVDGVLQVTLIEWYK